MKKTVLTQAIYCFVALVLLSSCGPQKTRNAIATDSLSIAQGQLLFQTNCSGCHNFRHDGIGPNLSGVTETDSAEWLREFIHSPKSMIDSGNEHAKNLLANYHSVMPSFASLKEEEINQL